MEVCLVTEKYIPAQFRKIMDTFFNNLLEKQKVLYFSSVSSNVTYSYEASGSEDHVSHFTDL